LVGPDRVRRNDQLCGFHAQVDRLSAVVKGPSQMST
jgi:hypothetical protein